MAFCSCLLTPSVMMMMSSASEVICAWAARGQSQRQTQGARTKQRVATRVDIEAQGKRRERIEAS